MTEGIDDDNEGEPQGRKGVRLETRQPFETRPGHHPGQNSDDQAQPSPPGKRACRPTFRFNFPVLFKGVDYQRCQTGTNDQGVKDKYKPRKRFMTNVAAFGRKFQNIPSKGKPSNMTASIRNLIKKRLIPDISTRTLKYKYQLIFDFTTKFTKATK
jgi:hypothetical protein